MLAAQLPPGSALWRSVGDDDAWSTEAHLLAEVRDGLSALEAQAAGAKTYQPVLRPAQQRAAALAAENKPTGEEYVNDQAARYAAREAVYDQQREESTDG